MSQAFLNSFTVTVPSTVIDLDCRLCSYGLPGCVSLAESIFHYGGRLWWSLADCIDPILRDYTKLDLNGTFLEFDCAAGWLAAGDLPAVQLHQHVARKSPEAPSLMETSHFTIFVRLIPASVGSSACLFAIFQFLWVWNDLLVALVFIGSRPGASFKAVTQD
jgi:alpha-glucoside transport system permease protein